MSRFRHNIKRVIDRLGGINGEPLVWTFHRWTSAGEDAYNNETFTLDATGVEVNVIRVEDPTPDPNLYPWGENRTVDVQLLVEDTIVGLDDIEDTTRKAPIFKSPNGIKFEAIAMGREGNIFGWARVFLEKVRDGSA